MTEKRYTYSELNNCQYSVSYTTFNEIYGEENVFYSRICEVNNKKQAQKVVDLLNEQEELIKRLKTIREEQTETILKQKRKIKELTTQLQTKEESVCIKCKHHYLTKKDPLHDAISNGEIVPFSSPLIDIKPYYISKCKKGHVECSKEDIRYCEDFKLSGDTQ